jgi:hypothetical protein
VRDRVIVRLAGPGSSVLNIHVFTHRPGASSPNDMALARCNVRGKGRREASTYEMLTIVNDPAQSRGG